MENIKFKKLTINMTEAEWSSIISFAREIDVLPDSLIRSFLYYGSREVQDQKKLVDLLKTAKTYDITYRLWKKARKKGKK